MAHIKKVPEVGSDTLGIIAGAGAMPAMVVAGAQRAGQRVVVVGLRGLADPCLRDAADVFYWSGICRLGRFLRVFRSERAHRAILAGSVKKSDMYGRFLILRYLPDWTTLKFWFLRAPDRRNDSLLRTMADMMAEGGVCLEPCVKYCMDAIASEGVLTRRRPSAAALKDLEFGWPLAKQMGRLDIGQSIAVKDREVIAVEAIEGTDRMIERTGALCHAGGWTLIKVAKPDQDMRFDVPTIGPDTIDNLKRHGAGTLVVEADKTFVVDKQAVIDRAERCGIVVVARRDTEQ